MDKKISFKHISGNTNDSNSAIKDYKNQYSASIQFLPQKYINNYRQSTSLYLVEQENKRAHLHIYDPKNLTEEVKALDASKSLIFTAPITQLPKGELLCSDTSDFTFMTAFIIDKDCKIRYLSSDMICWYSTAIYFNNNVYFFGGIENYSFDYLAVCYKFDLNEDRWSKLSQMPETDYDDGHSLVFKRNILISGYKNKNIWLYSIDINSFSTIPYDFSCKKRKILVYAEKLYLIESNDGLIYESEDEYNWKPVSNSIFSSDLSIFQVYWSYNKVGIYIVISDLNNKDLYKCYYKFDLDQKIMIKGFWETAENLL